MDRTLRYAEGVLAGDIVANRLVRQACERHVRDMETQVEHGLIWNLEEAEDAIEFFRTCLCLPDDVEEEDGEDDGDPGDDGQPFVLSPWQEFIVGSLLGWYTVKGFLRFRTAYIETGKGSGKTPLCAGILLYLLITRGRRGAQFYCAAVTKDQAKLAFDDCDKMVKASAHLRRLIKQTQNNLALPETGAFIRAISSEKRGLDGKRINGAVVDELHEDPTATVAQKVRKGIKNRRNAMVLYPTNSGFDRTSVCWAYHDYSRNVLSQTIDAPDWFAFVCGLDPCQPCADAGKRFPDEECPNCDDWKTEGSHWLKANPNLGVSLPWQYVRDLVRQARGMPSDVSDVLRFNFCVWTQGYDRAIDMVRWGACQELPSEDELAGADVFGCLDLGETDDFSASGRLYVLQDGRIAIKMRYYLPEAALQRYPDRPYDEWRRGKILTVTGGDVTDYATIRADILDDWRREGLISVFYDTKTARETAQLLVAEGIDMVPMTQGFALHEAIKRLLELVINGALCHGHQADPILSWMASNLVLVKGTKGEKRIAKERAPEKIDGMAALVMGIEGAIIRRERIPDHQPTVYFMGGPRVRAITAASLQVLRGRPPRAEAASLPNTVKLSPAEQQRVKLAARVNRQNFNEFARDALLTAAEDCLEPTQS